MLNVAAPRYCCDLTVIRLVLLHYLYLIIALSFVCYLFVDFLFKLAFVSYRLIVNLLEFFNQNHKRFFCYQSDSEMQAFCTDLELE